jgi:hypothetical protein
VLAFPFAVLGAAFAVRFQVLSAIAALAFAVLFQALGAPETVAFVPFAVLGAAFACPFAALGAPETVAFVPFAVLGASSRARSRPSARQKPLRSRSNSYTAPLRHHLSVPSPYPFRDCLKRDLWPTAR